MKSEYTLEDLLRQPNDPPPTKDPPPYAPKLRGERAIQIRGFSNEEYQMIKRAARQSSMSMESYCRQLLIGMATVVAAIDDNKEEPVKIDVEAR